MHSVAGAWVTSGKKCTSGNSLLFTWWEAKEKTEGGRGEYMAGEELSRQELHKKSL